MTLTIHGKGTVRSRRALVAGSVGNLIEWYEFGVYGYFATIIAARFFTPEGGSEAEALVKTYASFALAFFFRRTTGKELFRLGRLRDAPAGFGTLPAEDVVATLTMLTARTVAAAVRSVGATEVIASGGGTRNHTRSPCWGF